MADAGRSLKLFYAALAAILVVGVVLIVRSKGGNPAAGLVASSECNAPPLADSSPPLRGMQLGPDSARIEIDEYSDFECPWCARFAILTMPDVRQGLIPTGLVKWRFKNFPLTEIHANTAGAHLAASCAGDQGKFWEMEDALYMNQERWGSQRNPEGSFLEYARNLGLDTDSFQVCMKQQRNWSRIVADKCDGIRLGVEGTPTFFVNGRRLPDIPAYDDLKRLVDSIAAATTAKPAAPSRATAPRR